MAELDHKELGIIRELLGAAFTSNEIETLAFDLFQSVYQDIAGAAILRSVKITTIVDHANKNGGIVELLNYVNDKNPYQYSRKVADLNAILQKFATGNINQEISSTTESPQVQRAKANLSEDSQTQSAAQQQ